jgi:hypothetical protein
VGKAHDGGAMYSCRGSIHHDHLNCRSVFNDLSFQTLPLGTICALRSIPLFDFRQWGSANETSVAGSTHLAEVVKMILQRRQELFGELPQARILAAFAVGLDEVDGLDVDLVLSVDVGLVEVRVVLRP